jgi:hypothetical protein
MALGDGWTSRVLTGLAEHLAAAGVGTWRATGSYQAGETGIVIRAVPASPDRIITLAAYPAGGGPGNASTTLGVQVRLRGGRDPRDVDDLADAIFDAIDSSGPHLWHGVGVSQVYRQSYSSLGQDSNGRWERSENYYLDAERPTVHRPT